MVRVLSWFVIFRFIFRVGFLSRFRVGHRARGRARAGLHAARHDRRVRRQPHEHARHRRDGTSVAATGDGTGRTEHEPAMKGRGSRTGHEGRRRLPARPAARSLSVTLRSDLSGLRSAPGLPGSSANCKRPPETIHGVHVLYASLPGRGRCLSLGDGVPSDFSPGVFFPPWRRRARRARVRHRHERGRARPRDPDPRPGNPPPLTGSAVSRG